jgi:CBS domain-containing protein
MTNCPLCNHLNLPGAAECEECGASLTQYDVRRTRTILEKHLHDDAVSVLEPRVPVTTSRDTTLEEAVATMRQASIGCLVVTGKNERLVGLLAERDLLRNAALESPQLGARTVGDVMTQRPESVREDRPLAYALQRMMVGDHRHLPVVDEERRAVGVISSRDVIRYLEEIIAVERQEG